MYTYVNRMIFYERVKRGRRKRKGAVYNMRDLVIHVSVCQIRNKTNIRLYIVRYNFMYVCEWFKNVSEFR